jgi:hypothetical protein
MADKKLKGNKRELNGKVEKVDPSLTRNGWIRSEDKALEEKRAKDLRRLRYQTAQGAIAREQRAAAEEKARQDQAREEKHQLLLKELGKK